MAKLQSFTNFIFFFVGRIRVCELPTSSNWEEFCFDNNDWNYFWEVNNSNVGLEKNKRSSTSTTTDPSPLLTKRRGQLCVHAIISNLDDSEMALMLRHALKKINSLINFFVKITIHDRNDFTMVARHFSCKHAVNFCESRNCAWGAFNVVLRLSYFQVSREIKACTLQKNTLYF